MISMTRMLNEFTHQFISSCLAVWSLRVATSTPTNTSLTDYVLKIVKESFHEVESGVMLANLFDAQTTTPSGMKSNWSESMYLIVSGLIERAGNLAYDVLKSILDRMRNDSKLLAKSSVFSRCVLLVLNKIKASRAGESGCGVVDADLLVTIEAILADNQTLMKKSMQIALKSLKN